MTAQLTIVGNTCADVSLTYSPTGKAVGKVGVAVNHRKKNQAGEWEDNPSFLNLVCFGELAENFAESCPKGSRIIAQGRLEVRQWETPDGEKRSSSELVADSVGPDLRWATAEIVRNERRERVGAGTPSPDYPDQGPF